MLSIRQALSLGRNKQRLQKTTISPGNELFSQGLASPVSSPLHRFTTVFEMGTGGTSALQSPREIIFDCDFRLAIFDFRETDAKSATGNRESAII